MSDVDDVDAPRDKREIALDRLRYHLADLFDVLFDEDSLDEAEDIVLDLVRRVMRERGVT